MRIKKDFAKFLEEHLYDIVEDHLSIWKDRYYRLCLKEILFDLHINYDYSADLEYISEELNRELTSNEQAYFINCFEKTVKANFYENGVSNRGW